LKLTDKEEGTTENTESHGKKCRDQGRLVPGLEAEREAMECRGGRKT
jgi:hypothetical protein